MLRVLTDSHCDVIVDALGQSVHVDESVGRGQLAPQGLLGLRVAHALQPADVVDWDNTRS